MTLNNTATLYQSNSFGFDHCVGRVWVLRRRSESLAVLCKRLQHGVGIVCEILVKDIGILRQSGKERKKNREMFGRHAEWPKVTDAVIKAWVSFQERNISIGCGVPVADVQKTTIHTFMVKDEEENEGLHPHIWWMKTPDFAHVYRGISPMNRVFIPTSAVCLVRPTQARRVLQRGQ